MVSFVHLFTLLSALVSVTLAEEAAGTKTDAVEEKWLGWGFGRGFYGAGFYGGWPSWISGYGSFAACGLWPSYRTYWFKEVGDSVARRSLISNSDHLYPRSQEAISCKGNDGQVVKIIPADCQKAVDNLISKKSASASCNSCKVTLASPSGKLAPTGAPAEALHSAASEVLKSCSSGQAAPNANQNTRRSPAEATDKSNQQFAMLISKGIEGTCN